MQVIELTIYTINELPTEKAKDNARNWWRSFGEFHWNDESRQSIETFCYHFGVRLKNWQIGPCSQFVYTTDAENRHFRGRKLKDFDREHMPTGYCLDCSLWQTFYDVFKRTGDAKEAFDSALHAGFSDWQKDMEDQMSDEYIDEHLEINGYTFTEDGKPFKG